MTQTNQGADSIVVQGALGERLSALALVFLKLGAIAFGGSAAHIALMEDEVVRKRQWLTRQQFLDMLGLTNLIRGPNSTQMAINVGFARAGRGWLMWAIAVTSLAVLWKWKVNPAWVVLGGGLAGIVLAAVQ